MVRSTVLCCLGRLSELIQQQRYRWFKVGDTLLVDGAGLSPDTAPSFFRQRVRRPTSGAASSALRAVLAAAVVALSSLRFARHEHRPAPVARGLVGGLRRRRRSRRSVNIVHEKQGIHHHLQAPEVPQEASDFPLLCVPYGAHSMGGMPSSWRFWGKICDAGRERR